LISWFRLLDARAVSAGGEGLFLREEVETHDLSRSLSPSDEDPEAVVSDLLSKPALHFFQKTQSFMGRITKIDKWHRSRGTVEDETEVMTLAIQIQRDNHKLYQHRHPLLDLAVAGKLEGPLLAPSITDAITRGARTALSNYQATFIHLHRVAYRHLPRTFDVCNAINVIRHTAHGMVDALRPDDTLPVNMLWPLLMWGSEEDNAEERAWILSTIRKMSSAVSNARITADVLEEVLRRQDETGQRTDIRTVMHDIFNSCFAIV
jgi:Fungal specific transcription factor domain